MDTEAAWDYLIDSSAATEAELQLVTSINGYSVSTLEDVLYARTGYRTFDQVMDIEDDDDYEQPSGFDGSYDTP